MLHSFILPDRTRDRLLELVQIQEVCVEYIAQADQISEAGLATFLATKADPFAATRSSAIANWVFSRTKWATNLANFASSLPVIEKKTVLDWLKSQLANFLNCTDNIETTTSFVIRQSLNVSILDLIWQFLQDFYTELYDSGIPANVFSVVESKNFSRRDIFTEFKKLNARIIFCAACDGSISLDHNPNGSYKSISGDLDHYFPKNLKLYPYLACHPYNLIPLCSTCNTKKSAKDPLTLPESSSRLTLSDSFLPYNSQGLSRITRLEIKLDPTDVEKAVFDAIKPTASTVSAINIEQFKYVYLIPARWNTVEEDEINTIGLILFDKIKDYLDDCGITEDIPILLKSLERLLCKLYEKQGREPLRYVMVWWLATILNTEVAGKPDISSTAFLRYLNQWYSQISEPKYYDGGYNDSKRENAGRTLCLIARGEDYLLPTL